MRRRLRGRELFWAVIGIIIVVTWVLWFFNYDIRDVLSSENLKSVSLKSSVNFPCESSLRERVDILNAKVGSAGNVKILEMKNFNDLQPAIEFLDEWLSSETQITNALANKYRVNYGSVPVAIVRREETIDGTTFPQLLVYTCDGSEYYYLGMGY